MGGMEPIDADSLGRQIRFIMEAGRLTAVLRQNTVTGGSRRENSAEHSWHIALMALVLGPLAPPGTDICRVMSMLLLHDLVEIDAGDLFLYAPEADQRRQDAAEQTAAERLFGLLPAGQESSVRALWAEFCERETAEARFARAMDRLQPILLNHAAGGGTWRTHGVTADQVLGKVRLIADGSPALGSYARGLVEDAVRQGFLTGNLPAGPRPATGA
ncbi:MAG: HD domain-containing protein [Streptosporangiaceae bacterium]|nr:HD domain-containing protein [Streptosporangiaceae bacterium]MBV9857980.1 HD domain-containing protein [Streptosporangiaceae bacterium]